MRRIAIINQKGGVGKTTTCVNLGAALAHLGRRVVLVDIDPQANLTLYLGVEPDEASSSIYTVLTGGASFESALRTTATDGLSLVPSNIDLSGAELELAAALGRETILRESVDTWEREARERTGAAPADYLIFDCAPSLGLLSINALAAVREVLITLQTEFFALQGMSKLVEVVQLLRRRMNPELTITGILPCLYDSRLKLGREVLNEIRTYFPGEVFAHPIRTNVKLAESPSYGQTIFEYAPESNGAMDHVRLALAVMAQEERDLELAQLPRPESEEAALATVRAAGRSTPTPVAAASDAPANEPPTNDSPEPQTPEILSKDVPRPEPGNAPQKPERSILRAGELPPLPPDAFDVLTGYTRS